LLKFISKASKTDDPEKLKYIYTELEKALESIKTDQLESTAFEYFNFISWTQHKITGRSFKSIIQEGLNP